LEQKAAKIAKGFWIRVYSCSFVVLFFVSRNATAQLTEASSQFPPHALCYSGSRLPRKSAIRLPHWQVSGTVTVLPSIEGERPDRRMTMFASRLWSNPLAARIFFPVCAVVAVLPLCAKAQRHGVGFTQIRPFVMAYEPVIGADGSVGGVLIDAEGVVSTVRASGERELTDVFASFRRTVPREFTSSSSLRKVSLARLEAAVAAAVKEKHELPDEIRYLGGLQRIRYVFVYPEKNDIVLAGPGEGWKADAAGTPVGAKTGGAVMLLDDLLVALRNVGKAREEGISCSIEPTAEGRRACAAVLRRHRQFSPRVVPAIERSLGPQQVLLTGVPATSHLARVMVAGDYRMKRIAMALDESPVAELPSYLQLLQSSRSLQSNMMPRWWLASDYEPLSCSGDGLAWELRGRGVKAMTEDDVITADGRAVGSGRANPVAQQWADTMNAQYDELSKKDPVFGQLRNVMDLCVVAALIERYDLTGRAGCSLPHLTRADSPLGTCQLNAPKTVATQCSYVKRGSDWIITASGGVEIDGWRIVERRQPSDVVVKLRHEATPPDTAAWCWN
jgi:hypothetical protein